MYTDIGLLKGPGPVPGQTRPNPCIQSDSHFPVFLVELHHMSDDSEREFPYDRQMYQEPTLPRQPRPMNSWLLFRQDKVKELKEGSPESTAKLPQAAFSKIISDMWKNASTQERQYYAQKAEEKKLEHHIKYPTYRYQPRPKTGRKSSMKQQIYRSMSADHGVVPARAMWYSPVHSDSFESSPSSPVPPNFQGQHPYPDPQNFSQSFPNPYNRLHSLPTDHFTSNLPEGYQHVHPQPIPQPWNPSEDQGWTPPSNYRFPAPSGAPDRPRADSLSYPPNQLPFSPNQPSWDTIPRSQIVSGRSGSLTSTASSGVNSSQTTMSGYVTPSSSIASPGVVSGFPPFANKGLPWNPQRGHSLPESYSTGMLPDDSYYEQPGDKPNSPATSGGPVFERPSLTPLHRTHSLPLPYPRNYSISEQPYSVSPTTTYKVSSPNEFAETPLEKVEEWQLPPGYQEPPVYPPP